VQGLVPWLCSSFTDVKLDISENKNLYKIKHPLKFEQLVKRKKFIHLFWNIIAIFLEFQNHYFKQGYLSFLVKVEGFF